MAEVLTARLFVPGVGVEVFLSSQGDLYLIPPPGRSQVRIDAPLGGVVATILAGNRCPDASIADVETVLDELVELGYVARGAPAFSPRYDRQQRVFAQDGIDPVVGQDSLARSSALVIGVGGVGGFVAAHLVRCGVGRLVVVDRDCVAEENLPRHALFRDADIGVHKHLAAARHLTGIACPSQQVDASMCDLSSAADARQLIRDADPDLIVLAADHPPGALSRWIDAAAHAAGCPWISGGQRPPQVTVGPLVVPGQTACNSCVTGDSVHPLAAELEQARAQSGFIIPAWGWADSLAADLMVASIIPILLGADVGEAPLAGRCVTVDLSAMTFTTTDRAVAHCDACRPQPQREEESSERSPDDHREHPVERAA